jgi:hypothetical protein
MTDDEWPDEFQPAILEELRIQEEADIRKDRETWDEYDYDEDAESVAARRHQCVVIPSYKQLQIDLDTEEAYTEHLRRYGEMLNDERSIFYKPHHHDVLPSSSGYPHRHVIITFPDMRDTPFWEGFKECERIALQAALNDDPKRTYLNMRRFVNGIKNPSRLFRSPQKEYETRGGCLYKLGEKDDKNFLSAPAADAVAQGYGFMYAEHIVKWLEEHQEFR